MIVLNVFLESNNIPKLCELLDSLTFNSNEESGCLFYNYYVNKNKIAIIEHWQNKEVLDLHANSEHFKLFISEINSLLIKPLEINTYSQEN